MGQNHNITDDVIVEMHILQTNWQFQMSWLYFLKKMREKILSLTANFAVQIGISTVMSLL